MRACEDTNKINGARLYAVKKRRAFCFLASANVCEFNIENLCRCHWQGSSILLAIGQYFLLNLYAVFRATLHTIGDTWYMDIHLKIKPCTRR